MRVMFVVDSKNLPPSYAERARRAIVNPGNWKRVSLLAVVFSAIAAFNSIFRPSPFAVNRTED